MLQPAPLGRTLPIPPLMTPAEGDDLDAAGWPTPRPPAAIAPLERRIVSASMLAKHWMVWACVSLALWAIGTAVALVIGRGALVLGLGGFVGGIVAALIWFERCYREARAIAREGQLVVGVTTFRRSRETLGGELSETFDALLGERCHSVVFSIGFIRHEVRVAFAEPRYEGEPCSVLVRPGARYALAFDRYGRAHVGELLRMS